MTAKLVVIIDDNEHQREFLCEVVESYLGKQWDVQDFESWEKAEASLLNGKEVAIAVVDLYVGRGNRQGLRDLDKIADRYPNCFKILVSSMARDTAELGPGTKNIDRFVSLRYINTDPVSELQNALLQAEKGTTWPEENHPPRNLNDPSQQESMRK